MRLGSRFSLWIKLITVLALILPLSGCWNRRELDTIAVVIGIGLDKAGEGSNIKITAQVAIPSKMKMAEETSSQESDAFWNIKSEADNVFTALRESTFSSSRKLYIGQNQILLFGEALAKDGIQKHLDFFLRDHEARKNEYIVVARGKAGDVLNVKSKIEKMPAIDIGKLLDNRKTTSEIVKITLLEFDSALACGSRAPVAPIIEAIKQNEEQVLHIAGTAVFKGDRTIGELSHDETKGYLWITNEVKGGVINAKASNGNICLEILHSKSKMTPEKKQDGRYIIRLSVKSEVNLGNMETPNDELSPEAIAAVESNTADVIRATIMSCIDKAQDLNSDIFGFGDAIAKKYPKEWKSMKDDWDKLFPSMETELEIEVILRGTGEINRYVNPDPQEG
jgi:spore germination protein KC